MAANPRIGIVMSSTRASRLADIPSQWLFDIAKQRDDAEFEIVDLRDYPMPLFDEKMAPALAPVQNPVAQRWAHKMAELDAYVFVTAEYNHSITGVLKNALDYLHAEPRRKPATFLGYGALGGARAIEHLRHILAELHVATLKLNVHLGRTELLGLLREGKTMADFPYLIEAAKPMLDDLVWWANALKAARALVAA